MTKKKDDSSRNKQIAVNKRARFDYHIDERFEFRWGRDPYLLTGKGDGTDLSEGTTYLIGYYLGLVHGFIKEN